MQEVKREKDDLLIGYWKVSEPTLEIFLPEKPNDRKAAVILCPGGGYAMESYRKEGTEIAKAFNEEGVAVFLLKYRLPSDSIMHDTSIGPLQDAQQAIKTVRDRAAEWNITPNNIGIMGFSAGGHLASTAGTHFNKSYIPNVKKTSLRPDFMILIYPVISMQDGLAHGGSRRLLLGEEPSQEKLDLFSNDQQVNEETPPTWLTHAGDDTVVPVANSIRFYENLIQNKVPSEMHLYPKGNHGFVLSIPTSEWMQPLFKWMQKSDYITEK
ncbi:endo-1,4-beta-xylanase [Arcticibacterium luteifluviistationis]|uniref:Endo-1,4-beta-xylanase n=2 Tax=Arcticibacterium luteifluviistationis TaxID=1784714 RepID=A0A2Z4GIK3_9BACT|nr:endo-1,4-beta-xylanase [Arcticibacterium luteifluviistationis]